LQDNDLRDTRAPRRRRNGRASARDASSVAASAGKNDSILSSGSVISCGVPSVVSVVK
jgi:hypothetical protein